MKKIVKIAVMVLCLSVLFSNFSFAAKKKEDKKQKETETEKETEEVLDFIVIFNAPETLGIGDKYRLEYEIDFTKEEALEIISSNEEVIKIEGDYLVALEEGEAKITVKTYNNKKSFNVTVQVVQVTGIDISPNMEASLGEEINLEPRPIPANATYPEMTFSSSDIALLEIDEEGKGVAKKSGTVYITIQSTGEVAVEVEIEIHEVEPEEIRTSVDKLSIKIEESDKLDIAILPEDVDNAEYTVTIKNENIIEMTPQGKVNALEVGETVIQIETWNGLVKEIPVEVYYIPVTEIVIDDSRMEYVEGNIVDIDAELNLKVSVGPEDATYPEIEWVSSDEDVIRIIRGEPEIVGAGTVTLTAKTMDIEESITFVVESNKISVYTLIKLGAGILVVAIIIAGISSFLMQKRFADDQQEE